MTRPPLAAPYRCPPPAQWPAPSDAATPSALDSLRLHYRPAWDALARDEENPPRRAVGGFVDASLSRRDGQARERRGRAMALVDGHDLISPAASRPWAGRWAGVLSGRRLSRSLSTLAFAAILAAGWRAGPAASSVAEAAENVSVGDNAGDAAVSSLTALLESQIDSADLLAEAPPAPRPGMLPSGRAARLDGAPRLASLAPPSVRRAARMAASEAEAAAAAAATATAAAAASGDEGGFVRAIPPPDAPGLRIADHIDLFRLAGEAEQGARELALRDPARIGDDELRRLTDAILTYEKIARATERGEANAAAWHGVARCEYRIGRFWAAHRALEKSYPENLDVVGVTARVSLQSMIADALFARGHGRVPGGWGEGRDRGVNGYAAARGVYEAVVVNDRLHPRAARALLRYGICALELGDLDAAEGAFRQAAREYSRGEAVFEARVRLAETLLRRHPSGDLPPETEREVDQLLAEAGYDEDAIHRFRRAPGADREAPPSPAELARIEQNAREQSRALDAMRARLPADSAVAAAGVGASTPGASTAALARAAAAREEREAAALLQQAQVFLRHSPKDSRAAARFQLNDLVERYPDTPSAEVARSLLARHFKD